MSQPCLLTMRCMRCMRCLCCMCCMRVMSGMRCMRWCTRRLLSSGPRVKLAICAHIPTTTRTRFVLCVGRASLLFMCRERVSLSTARTRCALGGFLFHCLCVVCAFPYPLFVRAPSCVRALLQCCLCPIQSSKRSASFRLPSINSYLQ